MTIRPQFHCPAVRSEGRLRGVLERECLPEAEPRGGECDVQARGLGERVDGYVHAVSQWVWRRRHYITHRWLRACSQSVGVGKTLYNDCECNIYAGDKERNINKHTVPQRTLAHARAIAPRCMKTWESTRTRKHAPSTGLPTDK